MDTNASPATRGLIAALGALAALALSGPLAPAEGQLHFGPQLSLADDADVGLGGRVVAGVEDYAGLEFVGSVDVFFPDNDALDYWELNGNLTYNFEVPEASSIRPYAGGGLNIARRDFDDDVPGEGSETDVGLNLLGGVKFPTEAVTPFVEARLEIEGGDQFVLTGGLLFP